MKNKDRLRADVAEESDSAGAASLTLEALRPAPSRWTSRPSLPELWLRELEGRRLREMASYRKKGD